jgi:hypothetical protein
MQNAWKKQLVLCCCRGAAFLLSLVICATFFLSYVHQAFAAASQIGTHVAYGDLSEQLKVINFVKTHGPPTNYPITIMVNIGASTAEIQQLADALNAGSFSINIRILGIATNTTADNVHALATNLNAVNWTQGKKPIVVFGNELNAYRGSEWGNSLPGSLQDAATIYAPLLNVMSTDLDHGKYDLSGVALDPYHSDLATTFIDDAKSAFANPAVTSFATNVYQGVSGAGGTDLQAGLDLYNHLAAFSPKSRRVFTEFGINPQIRDVKATLDFYQQYDSKPLPGGFEYATALIPNLCDKNATSGNQWYFYIVGKIYNEKLQEVDQSCAAQANNQGGVFIYPGPVDIWNNTNASIGQRAAIFEAAISHDYLLTCSPQIELKANLSPSDAQVILNPATPLGVQSLLSHCDSGKDTPNCVFNVGDESVSVIADNGSIPLIRSNAKGRTSSFEGFFTTDVDALAAMGANAGANDAQNMMLFSPSSKLTPRRITCEKNIEFLSAIDKTCDQIPPNQEGTLAVTQKGMQQTYFSSQHINVNPCGLNTSVNNVNLRQIISDVRTAGFNGHEADYCSSDAFNNPDATQANLADLVMKVQPVTPDAYRIGYIIIYISGKPGDLSAGDMITRIVRPMDPGYLRNIFKIVPVLVPANFGTQKSDVVRDARGTTVVGGSFDGAFKRTIDPILPAELIANTEKQAAANQENVRAKMDLFGGKTVNDTGMVYLPYCNNPLGYSASGLSDTDAALNCYMADYINANLNIGTGNIMQHTAQLAPCRFYQDLAGGETADVLNSPLHPLWDLQPLETNLGDKPSVNINGQIVASHGQSDLAVSEEDAKIRVFFAVPNAEFGLIKDYEQYLFESLVGRDMFQQIYDSAKQKQNINTNGYLRMINVILQQTGSASKTFTTKLIGDNGLPLVPPQSTNVTAQFDVQGNANPVLWGGWLSKFVYTYSANAIAGNGEKPYQPFNLANRLLEPYWLGTAVAGSNNGGSPGPVLSCMHVWVSPQIAQQHADALLATLPTQKTLWADYYKGFLSSPIRTCSQGPNPDPSLYGPTAIQYLFETIPECNNEPCYQYIIEQTLARKTNDGNVIDPYITISIALNEDGGLKTARLDKFGQHFGVIPPTTGPGHVKECAEDIVYMGGIDEKLQIMLNTLIDYSNSGKTGVQGLQTYGYTDGGSAMVRLTNLLSGSTYTPYCGN